MKKILLGLVLFVPPIVQAGTWASKPFDITEPHIITCNAKFEGYGTDINGDGRLNLNKNIRITIKINHNELKIIRHIGEQDMPWNYKKPKAFIGTLKNYKFMGELFDKAFNDASMVTPYLREAFISVSGSEKKRNLKVVYSEIIKARYKQTGDEWFINYVGQDEYVDCHTTLPEIL